MYVKSEVQHLRDMGKNPLELAPSTLAHVVSSGLCTLFFSQVTASGFPRFSHDDPCCLYIQ